MDYLTAEEAAKKFAMLLGFDFSMEHQRKIRELIRSDRMAFAEEYKGRWRKIHPCEVLNATIIDGMIADIVPPRPEKPKEVPLGGLPFGTLFKRADGRFSGDRMKTMWADTTLDLLPTEGFATICCWDQEGREYHWPADMLVIPEAK